ncbi:MAG: alpha/beta hydrolase [Alphaproteobacteria bacterium]|nr:alpha/beta hydrolase [Alphaproteobacteria bacterium]
MNSDLLNLEILTARPPEGVPVRPTPLVFLHGAFAGAWCWSERFLPYFATLGYRCYAPSFRGHGDSDGQAQLDRYGIADYVSDLASVVRDLDVSPMLIGHSMGGFVAMKYAETREVAGLALLASVPPGGLIGPSMSLATWNPMLMFEIGMAQAGAPGAVSMSGLRQALFSDRVPPERVERYMPQMGGESSRAVAEMHGTIRVDPNRLRGRIPLCVMGAQEDGLIPPAFIRSTARQLGVEATILDRAGHGMMLDETWQATADALARWMRANDI